VNDVMIEMKDIIEQRLQVLVGLLLIDAGRTLTLEWFDFGSNVPTQNAATTLIGRYAIDTEEAWHIVGLEGIVVGSRDRLYPAGEDPYKDLLEFDWDHPGVNRCDERILQFLNERKDAPLIVQSVEANNWGGIKINFSANYILEIFPDGSLDNDYWRLFEPGKKSRHFVVTAHGIEI
jgi:hypothetical protein